MIRQVVLSTFMVYTKLSSDKLFVASNSSYAGGYKTSFSVVR